MADYRQIHTKIWNDEWFLDLDSDAKLLFIYLFSNPRACLAGIYDIPLKVICFDTDLSKDFVTATLEDFESQGKAYYQDGWIFVPKLVKYNAGNIKSPKVQANLRATIESLNGTRLKALWIQLYGNLIGYQYHIDTISEVEQEQEQEQEQEREQEQIEQKLAPPKPKRTAKPKTPTPPAIAVYREKAQRFPHKTLYQDIIETVGDDPEKLKLWGDVVKAYIAHGWNPANIAGMLDFFKRGEIPGPKTNGKPPTTGWQIPGGAP